mmetsp:Transcript_23328/g.47541  ORF Transcript_23328/g.47541 Transcript_23328/m.47541 type:complete len:210 (+) Transcript_23328:3-632(+)
MSLHSPGRSEVDFVGIGAVVKVHVEPSDRDLGDRVQGGEHPGELCISLVPVSTEPGAGVQHVHAFALRWGRTAIHSVEHIHVTIPAQELELRGLSEVAGHHGQYLILGGAAVVVHLGAVEDDCVRRGLEVDELLQVRQGRTSGPTPALQGHCGLPRAHEVHGAEKAAAPSAQVIPEDLVIGHGLGIIVLLILLQRETHQRRRSLVDDFA